MDCKVPSAHSHDSSNKTMITSDTSAQSPPESTEYGSAHLPPELTQQILVCLPVKDLIRFRTVCKSWKSQIDSYSFKIMHFQRALKLSDTLLLARRHDYRHRGVSPTLHFLSPNHCSSSSGKIEYSASSPLRIPDFTTDPVCRVFGCVHNLAWLAYPTCYVVWTIGTLQHRIVEPLPENWVRDTLKEFESFENIVINSTNYAFGFDPTTQDYKLLAATFIGVLNKALVQVYSLRANSWRRLILDFPYVSITMWASDGPDGYLDGSFYWFAKECYCKDDDDGSSERAIVRFDFTDDTFELIHLPGNLPTSCMTIFSVAVTTRGCLELIIPFTEGNKGWCDIWRMGEDGLWSRNMSFGPGSNILRPRGITRDGHLVSNLLGETLVVNPDTGTCKNLGLKSAYVFLFTYVESLFAVNL